MDALTSTWCETCEDYVSTVTHPWLEAEYDYKTLLWGVYDIETILHSERDMKTTISALRKEGRLGELGVSCVAIWSSDTLETDIYGENEVEEAVQRLENLDAVVDYNGTRFDRRVLEGVLQRETHFKRYTDILRFIWDGMDTQRIPKGGSSLGEVALATLGSGKSGKGDDAPTLHRQGLIGQLHRYCMQDVRLTKNVLMHMKQHGFVRNGKGYRIKVEAPKWLT
jgi:DEAD/DEAH box helicase domain-containing protein